MSNKRREFIVKSLIGTAGLVVGGLSSAAAVARSKKMEPPYPYKYIDPDMIAEKAYGYYLKGHCAYGVFASILDTLKESVGGPYLGIPGELFEYGKSGINGWGTICGALNGAAAIISISCKGWKKVIDALYSMKKPLFLCIIPNILLSIKVLLRQVLQHHLYATFQL
ncbi:hypothetical protein [Desulfurobacterium sp.]